MSREDTFYNLIKTSITTYHSDGTESYSRLDLLNGGYKAYHPDGTNSVTYENLFDDGYTTYHSDGGRSVTYKNLFDDGYTTYHSNGSRSVTYKSILTGGYVTYDLPDGSFGAGHKRDNYQTSPGEWLGSTMEKLSKELLVIDNDLLNQLNCINDICSRLTNAINETHIVFGEEQGGQEVIVHYYQVVRHLNDAIGMLYIVSKNIINYIEKLRS